MHPLKVPECLVVDIALLIVFCGMDVNSLQFLNVNERSLILVLLALVISPFSPKDI